MLRSYYALSCVLVMSACDGHRDIRLLEPAESTFGGAGGRSAQDVGAAGVVRGGTGTLVPTAGAAAAQGGAVTLPTPKIIFKNILILKTLAHRDGATWQLSDSEVAAISQAFRVTFPALIDEFTAGSVVFDNYVIVSGDAVDSVGYNHDMVEPENVPGWESLVGPSGSYDCAYIVTARPQSSIYARYDLTSAPIVAWISDGPRADLAPNGGAMAAWLWGWLATMGPMFYDRRLGLDHVPGTNTSDEYGYARNQDGLPNFLAWHRDYLNRKISFEGAYWGLGEPAWALGTLRDWAKMQ